MAEAKKATGAKKTRAKATPDKVKAQLAKAKKRVEALEQKAYAVEIEAQIQKSNIVSAYNGIKSALPKVSDLTILAAVAKAVKVPRVVVTQSEAKPRKTTTAKS